MTMFQLFQILSILLATLMWTLVGQGVLRLLLKERADTNIIYRFFAAITRPVVVATRFITPRFVVDAHIGYVAFFLLLMLRVGLYMLFYSQGWLPTLAESAPVP